MFAVVLRARIAQNIEHIPAIRSRADPGGMAMRETRTSFGELLRQLRHAATLSQEELAERSGVSRNGISALERGLHAAPRLETVRLLADALNLADTDRSALLGAAHPTVWAEARADRRPPPLGSWPAPLTRLIGRAETSARSKPASTIQGSPLSAFPMSRTRE